MAVKFAGKGSVEGEQTYKVIVPLQGTDYTDHLEVVKYQGKQVKAVTESQKTKSGSLVGEVEYKEEVLGTAMTPLDKLAHVTLSMGRTYNLGNYESYKIQISLTVPTGMADINDAYEFADKWLDERLKKVEEDIKGAG